MSKFPCDKGEIFIFGMTVQSSEMKKILQDKDGRYEMATNDGVINKLTLDQRGVIDSKLNDLADYILSSLKENYKTNE